MLGSQRGTSRKQITPSHSKHFPRSIRTEGTFTRFPASQELYFDLSVRMSERQDEEKGGG